MSTERITKGPEDRVDASGLALAAVLRDCVSCGLLLAGPGDTATILNTEAAHLLELPIQTTHSLSNLAPALRTAVQKVLQTGSGTQEVALIQTAAGERIQVGLWAAPVGASEGKVVLALNRFVSVGPPEPDLQRLDRLANTGILSAGLAHEIKNALVPVKTFTDLLLERHPDAELADIVRRELARVESIVSRLLRFARPAASASVPFHLHDTLDYALRLVQHQVQPGSINVQRSFAARSDTVSGDESQLYQAFINILMNGIEAMGPAGTLTVATENRSTTPGEGSPELLRISVKDTGPGIATENLGRLFEPFFTTKSNGTGLGLAVARRIFAEHNGTISVESRAGEGSTFIVVLRVWERESQ